MQHIEGNIESYIEEKMQGALQRWHIPFRTQVKIGPFYADFLLEDSRFWNSKLIIECDGRAFHTDEEKKKKRDEYLEKKGFTIVHLFGSEIMKNPYDCVGIILERYWPETGNKDERWKELHEQWIEWFNHYYQIFDEETVNEEEL